MATLRMESENAQTKIEELNARIKQLEQENLTKEQEITSLSHRNQLLESDVEGLEAKVKELKTNADMGANSSQEAESLQRKLQLLEEEAEEADKTLRETTEKYVLRMPSLITLLIHPLGYASLMSRPSITNEKLPLSQPNVINGRRNMRKRRRRTRLFKRSSLK